MEEEKEINLVIGEITIRSGMRKGGWEYVGVSVWQTLWKASYSQQLPEGSLGHLPCI